MANSRVNTNDEKGRTQSQSVSTVGGSSQAASTSRRANQLHIGGADRGGQGPDADRRQRDYRPRLRSTHAQRNLRAAQSGLSVALSGTVGGALNTAVSSAQQAKRRRWAPERCKNTAALSGVQAAQAAELDKLNTDAGKKPPTPSASALPTAASRRRAKPAPTAASRRAARSPPGKTCR
ncbi:hypothetical protein J4732_18745 [Serratia marcescens]|uniref:Uncharacterized protein n=1 Tax=Serratia marcescens TaxID=615 RepID=A0A939NMP6_SERMA|nr:hypothetical protein [Serratia marcescens]